MSSQLRVTVPREHTGNSIRDSALGLVPETVEPLIALNERVWNGGAVRPALLELVRLRNARLVNCVVLQERALRRRSRRWADGRQGGRDHRRLRAEQPR